MITRERSFILHPDFWKIFISHGEIILLVEVGETSPIMNRYDMIIKGIPVQICWEFTESMIYHKMLLKNLTCLHKQEDFSMTNEYFFKNPDAK